jgi:hypothetical protein
MANTKTLVLFCAQHNQSRNKLHNACLSEASARDLEVRDRAAGLLDRQGSYELSLRNGDIVHIELDEKTHRRIEKSGVVFVAFHSNLCGKEATPYAVAASKSGLVKEARRTCPNDTEVTLFEQSNQAGAFLIEGYPVPSGLMRSPFGGALLEKQY